MDAVKIRLCFIIEQIHPSGAELQLLTLVRELDRSRFNIDICVLRNFLGLKRELIAAGANLVCMHKTRRIDLPMLYRLLMYLRRGNFDIVQTVLTSANLWGRIAAILAGVPRLIASERNVEDWKPRFLLFADRILSYKTDLILANSEAVRDFVLRTTGILPDRCRLIYNGLDLSRFSLQLQHNESSETSKLRDELGLVDGDPVVGTVGRLAEQKDHATFLRACRLIADEVPACRFLIVGEGEELDQLEAFSGSLGLDGRVIFAGWRQDVARVMSLMDIFVLSSIREGFANVIIEAMALGKPVVVTRVGGNAEAVVDGETGYIIPPKSPVALCQALLSLIRNQEAARRMGVAGRKRAQDLYETSKMVEATAEVYEMLMKVEPSRKFGD